MKLISRDSVLDLSRIHVMGILNVTPDSFFDGGKYNKITNAIEHVNLMINSGATIIDVGGESTRPGSKEISIEEELSRVIPVIEAIKKRFDVWISVDTSKKEVIQESAKVGVHMINDVRSLSEPGTIEAIIKTDLPVCLVHMKGKPKTMQKSPKYIDIFSEINQFFFEKISYLKYMGIKKEKLLLDPGFGFGKKLFHNYELLINLSEFCHFKLPLLVGMSRKSMISKLLNVNSSKCLIGSVSCAVIAAICGANIIRVHDVKETVEAIRIVEASLLTKKNKNLNIFKIFD